MEVDEASQDKNEQLVQMYKDAAEKKTKPVRAQSSFHQIAKESRKNGDLKTKYVPLKVTYGIWMFLISEFQDILSTKKEENLPEDSDEDQFEQSDDGDEATEENDEKIEAR
jgi:hypothetical protein